MDVAVWVRVRRAHILSSWLETAMKFGGSCWKPQLDFSDCRMAVRLAGTDKVEEDGGYQVCVGR